MNILRKKPESLEEIEEIEEVAEREGNEEVKEDSLSYARIGAYILLAGIIIGSTICLNNKYHFIEKAKAKIESMRSSGIPAHLKNQLIYR